MKIPKATISNWCKDVPLPPNYSLNVNAINRANLIKARIKARAVNHSNRMIFLKNIDDKNLPIAKTINDFSAGMIAMAMLCLGEASKYKTKHRQFSLGSSDPRIIVIFLKLLKRFYQFDSKKLRCTVQCRADQNTVQLEKYWQRVSQVPASQFYRSRIDKRTIGKKTINKDYRGVLVIDYYDLRIQLILESLSQLVYNQLLNEGP